MKYGLKLILFYCTMFVALGLFWFWWALPSRDLITLEPNVKLQCLSYAPFGKDESPFDFDKGLKLSSERIDKDLALLSQYTHCIRTYSSVGLEMIPAIARKHGLKMWLGAWVNADPLSTRKEINTLIALAKENADIIETVVVGNEVLLRREISAKQLTNYIAEVKKALPKITVTYADVWEFWNKHPDVAPAVDRVTIHILPYWEDKPISVDAALLHVKNIRSLMKQKIPDKEIVIGETGWPSQGRMRETALPSPQNQAIFTRNFVKMAEAEGWKYNFIEAFDQPWKRVDEGAAGGYWGLFDANRADKHVLHGFVSNFPNALWLFGASFLLSCIGLVWLFRTETCQCKKAPQLFFTLFIGSIGLIWQGNTYLLTARNVYEYGWAAVCMSISFILWLILVRFVVNGQSDRMGSMNGAIAFLLRQKKWNINTTKDLLHLVSVSVVLIMAMAMAFDGRYRDFEMGTLGIIALVYFTFFISGTHINENTILEKVSGLILLIASLFVLLQESARNSFALNWVLLVVLLGIALWMTKEKLCGLTKTFIILTAFGLLWWALKTQVYVNESLVEVCALTPHSFICQLRFWMSKAVYQDIGGWVGLILVTLSFIKGSYWLGLIAMCISLSSLLLFHGTLGSIVFVLGWWVVGYRINNSL
ncbi:MAG: exo-beta-1,3-glucanase [Sulfurospirillaceae bacterium]|nr:exo-beta-1,3-glucanase [Sulfurospirillaceae bacterium]MDD2827665.1 exo-beta-1,3-glucanase [Sulfurospirillaceae bacterium]